MAPLRAQELPANQRLNVLALCVIRSHLALRGLGPRARSCGYVPSLQKLTGERLEIAARFGDVAAVGVRIRCGMSRDTSRQDFLHLRLEIGSLIGGAGRPDLNEERRRADCQETTEGFESLR